MQISKSKAEEVAKKLTAKKLESIKELGNELRKIATAYYEDTIPKEVISAFKKHKSYFSASSLKYSRIEGLGATYVDLSECLPSGNQIFEMKGDAAEKYVTLRNRILDEEAAYNKLRADIENSIVQLRTYKNILSVFPEAAAHIDTNKPNLPMIPVEDIRKRLSE